ncbi:MAG: M4 family metallopeptidase [Patescibacteria group bacterium]|nr:M4 family metallopeptidase [Patescibacteria group bacterium]
MFDLKGKITIIFLIIAFLLAIVFFFVPLLGNALEDFEMSRLNLAALREKEVQASEKKSNPRAKGEDAAWYAVDKETENLNGIFLKGRSVPAEIHRLAQKSKEKAAKQFLEDYGGYFGIDDPEKDLKLVKKSKDKQGITHLRYNQEYEGVPVFGGQMIVHLKKDLSSVSANAGLAPDVSLDVDPRISKEKAEKEASEKWEEKFDGENPKILDSKLVVFSEELTKNDPEGKDSLVWLVEIFESQPRSHEYYFVDAKSGKIIFQITGIKEINRQVFDCSNGDWPCYLDDLVGGYTYGRSEGQPARGANPAQGGTDVDDSYDMAGSMHNYLQNEFSRNGGNNQGGIGDGYYTDVANTDVYDYLDGIWGGCPNAFFDGFSVNFCKGLVYDDVFGHEYGHAIVDFSVSGGLTYSYESGALHEAYADIFGETLENERTGSSDWLAGADVNISGFTGPLRSIRDPGSLGDPARFYDSNFYCGSSDYGGVHLNSPVVSHAAYLLTEGGSFNGCSVSGIGRDKMERIFYRALTSYFTSSTDFNAAYSALNLACGDLYGTGSGECVSVRQALQAAEINQGGRCSGEARATPLCGDTTPPQVSEVAEDQTYDPGVAIAFDEGTAVLNGVPVSSGTVVNEPGDYTLVVTDAAGNSTTIHFTIRGSSGDGDETGQITTDTPALEYRGKGRATKRINIVFHGRNLDIKKRSWVSGRLGGKKVKIMKAENLGEDFLVSFQLKYKKMPPGTYSFVANYKLKTGKRSWEKGTLTAENILTISN